MLTDQEKALVARARAVFHRHSSKARDHIGLALVAALEARAQPPQLSETERDGWSRIVKKLEGEKNAKDARIAALRDTLEMYADKGAYDLSDGAAEWAIDALKADDLAAQAPSSEVTK